MTKIIRDQHIASIILASLALGIAIASGLGGIALFGLFLAAYTVTFLTLKGAALRTNWTEMHRTTSTSERPRKGKIFLKVINMNLILQVHTAVRAHFKDEKIYNIIMDYYFEKDMQPHASNLIEATLKVEKEREEREVEVTPQLYVAAHTCVKEHLKNENLTELVMEYYLDRADEPYATKLMAQELYKAKRATKQEQAAHLEKSAKKQKMKAD
jgi:hypothetical protein